MAATGATFSVTFNSVTNDADNCIQSWSITDGVNGVTYDCNGYTKTIAGTSTTALNITIAAGLQDATLAAWRRGTSASDFSCQLGSTTGDLKLTSADAVSIKSEIGGSSNSVMTTDYTIAINTPVWTTVS